MVDITGFGLKINVIASVTFPVGINLTQFADDGDPFDIPSLQIADTSMGLNGDMLQWAKANPIKITLNMAPQTDDDTLLGILFEANRVGRGKRSVNDIITMTAIYPSGRFQTLINGRLTDGMPGLSVASAGRIKTRPYTFAFENRIGVGI